MITAINIVHWFAGLIILAEALNKLEYCDPLKKGLSSYARLIDVLKALAWSFLALGAAGVVVSPAMGMVGDGRHAMPGWLADLADTAALLGFMLLIIRTRVREIEGHTVFHIDGTDTSPDKLAERQ